MTSSGSAIGRRRPRFKAVFYKNISKNTDETLTLPKTFVKDYGDELSNPVHVKFRGKKWYTEIKRYKDKALFDKVSILQSDPDVDENDEENFQPSALRGGQAGIQEEAPSLETRNLSHKSKSKLKRKRKFSRTSDGGDELKFSTDQVLQRGTSEVMKRANAFRSRNPFFRIEIPATDGYGLELPFEFVRKHLLDQSGEVILQISDGRIWFVELECENSRAKFENKWLDFMQDNNLKVGDVCVFVLIDGARRFFEVVNFYRDHNIEFVNCTLPPESLQEEAACNTEARSNIKDSGLTGAQQILQQRHEVSTAMHSVKQKSPVKEKMGKCRATPRAPSKKKDIIAKAIAGRRMNLSPPPGYEHVLRRSSRLRAQLPGLSGKQAAASRLRATRPGLSGEQAAATVCTSQRTLEVGESSGSKDVPSRGITSPSDDAEFMMVLTKPSGCVWLREL